MALLASQWFEILNKKVAKTMSAISAVLASTPCHRSHFLLVFYPPATVSLSKIQQRKRRGCKVIFSEVTEDRNEESNFEMCVLY